MYEIQFALRNKKEIYMAKSVRKYISLNVKIALLFSIMLLFFIVFNAISYFVLKTNIDKGVEKELKNATDNTLKLAEHAVNATIRNYLRAIAEKNRDIVRDFDNRMRSGELSKEKGMKELRDVLLSQKIGDTGYIFVWDISEAPERLPLVIHPIIENSDLSPYPFAQDAAILKDGYLEYDWKNPDDPLPRKKAVYLSYYEPWNWVIVASSYREEFHKLINIDDFNEIISSQRFGDTGYTIIIDYDGNIIYHPYMKGNQIVFTDDNGLPIVKKFVEQKQGFLEYVIRDPNSNERQKKMAYFNDYPELRWVVISSGYRSEFNSPLKLLLFTLLLSIFSSLIIFTAFFIWSRRTIIEPVRELEDAFEKGSNGDLAVRIPVKLSNEIYLLAEYFNHFMQSLQVKHEEIEEESRKLRIAEAMHKSASEYLDNIVNSLDTPLITVRSDGSIAQWNHPAYLFTQIPADEAQDKNYLECLPFLKNSIKHFEQALKTDTRREITFQTIYKEKEKFLQVIYNPLLFNGVRGIVIRINDITETKIKDIQLRQAQKMEIIGNLAGGLAHDFNNILGGITGTVSLIDYVMKNGQLDEEKLKIYIEIISQSAIRAKEVVEQLLTISRKREVDFKTINIRKSIDNVLQVCRSTFDKSINIEVDLPRDKYLCRAESTQIEQALLNLFVNASHAMTIMRKSTEHHGGTLSIGISEIYSDSYFVETHPEAQQIKYWRISVSDTGVGMDSRTVSKIFEPFFSLKSHIKGSGLGLSMVYNIIRQHEGFIDVYSEIGVGTVFNLFLPAVFEGETREEATETIREAIIKGSGLILVVDDNDIIRKTAHDILIACGYDVIFAEDGAIGVEVYRARQEEITAVIMDMVMPNKSGREAFIEIKEINPDVKVAIASGYRMDLRVQEVLDAGAKLFIQKPFTLSELSEAVHKLITE